ncbi:MAG: helix-turn-helix domain-containing protein [Ruminococcaceae bacterium]|nr:helix-turn-helix domain-containing protein [Oscillospiraceae bacterium]
MILSIGAKIKRERLAKGYTLDELAKKVGTSKQTIFRYEADAISNIPPDKIEALAFALGTTPAYLMGWESEDSEEALLKRRGIMPIRKKKIPLCGEISCGQPIYAEENRETYVSTDCDFDADFCLTAHGDSMIGARIYDGDLVFIKKQPTVENGEIAVVIIEDEATLKRVYYYPEESKLILCPENPHYAPMSFSGAELDRINILGKAVAFQSKIR